MGTPKLEFLMETNPVVLDLIRHNISIQKKKKIEDFLFTILQGKTQLTYPGKQLKY